MCVRPEPAGWKGTGKQQLVHLPHPEQYIEAEQRFSLSLYLSHSTNTKVIQFLNKI